MTNVNYNLFLSKICMFKYDRILMKINFVYYTIVIYKLL